MFCVHFPCWRHCPKREQEIKPGEQIKTIRTTRSNQKPHTELQISKTYKKSPHPVNFGVRRFLCTAQNAAGGKAFDYLPEKKPDECVQKGGGESSKADGGLRFPACPRGRPAPSSLPGSVHMTSADSSPATALCPPAAATAPSFEEPF